jgi:hypothetical protein
MVLKIFISIVAFFFFSLSATKPTLAVKKRVWKSLPVSTKSSTVVSGAPSVSAKLTGWKQYLQLTFKNASAATNITYELTYNGNGQEQGVFGSLNPSEGNPSRSLFLGTCSHNVCVSHKNVNTVRLAITYQLKSGQEIVKRYKIKY